MGGGGQTIDPVPSLEEVDEARSGIQSSEDLAHFLDLLVARLENEGGDFGGELTTLLTRIQALFEDDGLFGDTSESRYPEAPSWKSFGDIINDSLPK